MKQHDKFPDRSNFISLYISTDAHFKPTDTYQYLDNRSCHKKQSIPYDQVLTIERICHSDEIFEERLNELRGHFIISRVLNRRLWVIRFRKQELNVGNEGNLAVKMEFRWTLVTDIHPTLLGLSKIIDLVWAVFHASESMGNVFGETKQMVAFRRPRNLKDSTVRSKVKRENNLDKGMKKCEM